MALAGVLRCGLLRWWYGQPHPHAPDGADGADAERVARVLKRFRATPAGDRGAERRPADRSHAAYERLLARLRESYAEVQREQLELDRSLR